MDIDRRDAMGGLTAAKQAPATASGRRPGLGSLQSRISLDAEGSQLRGGLVNGNDKMSRLLTVEEVAALLNVPRKWVYRRVGLKPPDGIPYLKVGKYLRFRESDLWNYVESLRRN
jgi:excisionase family DNA binding protein